MGVCAVGAPVAVRFLERRRGAPGRRGRVAGGLGGLILVGEPDRPPGSDQVGLDVLGEHAQERVRPDLTLETAVDRTDFEVDGLE